MSLNNQLTGATRPLLLPRGSNVEKELTIWDLWAVLRRRRAEATASDVPARA